MKQSPIFSKTYDLVAWLIPLTIKFPRSQRFGMAATLQREAIRFQELLIEAAHQRNKFDLLSRADAELDKNGSGLNACLVGVRWNRGGSWNNNHRNVRCANRNRNIPDNFNNNIGFRLVSHDADQIAGKVCAHEDRRGTNIRASAIGPRYLRSTLLAGDREASRSEAEGGLGSGAKYQSEPASSGNANLRYAWARTLTQVHFTLSFSVQNYEHGWRFYMPPSPDQEGLSALDNEW
jgi:hypothetical protein